MKKVANNFLNLLRNPNELAQQAALILHNRVLGNEKDAIRYKVNRLPENERADYVQSNYPAYASAAPWSNDPLKIALLSAGGTGLLSYLLSNQNLNLIEQKKKLENSRNIFRDSLKDPFSKQHKKNRESYQQQSYNTEAEKGKQFMKVLLPTLVAGTAGYYIGDQNKKSKNEAMLNKMLNFAGLTKDNFQKNVSKDIERSDIHNFYKV
jgi:hypothetical protein